MPSTLTPPTPAAFERTHQSVSNDLIDASFNVPWNVHFLSGLVSRFPWMWRMLGNLETLSVQDKLESIRIDRPIFIAGIARSGSTILLESLAAHAATATHQYRDFPLLFTPLWWNQAQPKSTALPVERAHGDGLMVTLESPEAMEEVLWQAFFDGSHNPLQNQALDRSTTHPTFEKFYREHVSKLLLLRCGQRYLSKGNYNFSRLPYLQKLFPDMRCLVPIRKPEDHIASLMKQQKLFTVGETKFPRALAQMQRIGHYEFGLDRRPINVGNTPVIQEVQQLWDSGEDIRGWARYWAHLYGWMADHLNEDESLRRAALVIRYEDLCTDAATWLSEIREHCELEPDPAFTAFAGQIHAPDYYRPKFTAAERDIIAEETAATALRYGYLEN